MSQSPCPIRISRSAIDYAEILRSLILARLWDNHKRVETLRKSVPPGMVSQDVDMRDLDLFRHNDCIRARVFHEDGTVHRAVCISVESAYTPKEKHPLYPQGDCYQVAYIDMYLGRALQKRVRFVVHSEQLSMEHTEIVLLGSAVFHFLAYGDTIPIVSKATA